MKKFKLRKEWAVKEEEIHGKMVNVDREYSEKCPYPIVNGKPFIWTIKDSEDVRRAYLYNFENRLCTRSSRDYIDDGMNDFMDSLDRSLEREQE